MAGSTRHLLFLGTNLLLSFPLDRKGPKDQGRHQGPTAHGGRPSPMSAVPPRPTRSSVGVPILVALYRRTSVRHREVEPATSEAWWKRSRHPAGSAKYVIPTSACAVAWDLCFAEPFKAKKSGPDRSLIYQLSLKEGLFYAIFGLKK